MLPHEIISLYVQISNVGQNHDTDVSVCFVQAHDDFYTEAYNDAHPDGKIKTSSLRDNADMGRVTLWGFNDLILKDDKGNTVAKVKGKTFDWSTVEKCDPGYAVGYYSYGVEESIELFFPVNRKYTLTTKSYSKEMSNDINYTVYCQYDSIGSKGVFKDTIKHYKSTSWFTSGSFNVDIEIIP
jgi:hypothetical protein